VRGGRTKDKMDLFKLKKKQEETPKTFSASDIAILKEAVNNGTPCIPFIPINALQQSLTVIKPEGLKGYYVARMPALYEDGTIRYLFKEEFSLWTAVHSLFGNIEKTGRTYFFLGFDQLMRYENSSHEYLSPLIFYQRNFSLFRMDLQEKLEFFRPEHSPLLELTYIPADHNIKIKDLHVINFFLVSNLHPLEEREDQSGFMEFYEQWKNLQYPIQGKDLHDLFDKYVQGARNSFLKPSE
jgi:hypothetical protein